MLHVADAGTQPQKMAGKTKTLAFLPCSQTSLAMEFLLAFPVSVPASESGLQLKLVYTTLKILLFKLKALITKKTSAKRLRFENVIF